MSRRWSVILAVLGALLIAACARYTFKQGATAGVPPNSIMAVSVWDPDVEGRGPSALEGYLTTSLVARGYRVRPLQLELIVGRSVLQRILPHGAYSAHEALIEGMKKGGQVEADQEVIVRALELDEMDDAKSRLEGIAEIGAALPKSMGIQYMVVVHRFDEFGYAVYAINVNQNTVVHALVVSGNQRGFQKALGDPDTSAFMRAEDGDNTRMEMLRLSEFIAENL